MKGQIQNDIIVSYGEVLSGADVFDIPGDYTPERYDYIPAVAGVYDPNGFIPKPPPENNNTPCPYCNRV